MAEVEFADLIWFAGWLGALVVLFWLALRLPLQTRLSRPGAQIYAAAVVVVIGAVAVLANFALALHDTHIDLTREKVTPSEQALEVVDAISRPVKLTYFFQGQDPNGQARLGHCRSDGAAQRALDVRTVDPDR